MSTDWLQGLTLSPIVSILFCSIVMAKYARPNLSKRAEARTKSFFKIVAHLAESFVFIYIGATLFLNDQAWHFWGMWTYLVRA
jgi:sodium/hydrogen exchanger 8